MPSLLRLPRATEERERSQVLAAALQPFKMSVAGVNFGVVVVMLVVVVVWTTQQNEWFLVYIH